MKEEIAWAWDYDSVRRILELFSFLGTTVVGGFALFIFRQLRMAETSLKTAQEALTAAKDDNQTRIQREAVVLAAQQTDRFRSEILRNVDEIDDLLRKNAIQLAPWPLKNHYFDGTSIEDLRGLNAYLDRTDKTGIQVKIIEVLNEMETYSLYFIEGAADEKVAFPLTSTLFCYSVQQFAPVLISLRKEESGMVSGPYKNLVALYELWSQRKKKAELETRGQKLLKESSEIEIKGVSVIGRREVDN